MTVMLKATYLKKLVSHKEKKKKEAKEKRQEAMNRSWRDSSLSTANGSFIDRGSTPASSGDGPRPRLNIFSPSFIPLASPTLLPLLTPGSTPAKRPEPAPSPTFAGLPGPAQPKSAGKGERSLRTRTDTAEDERSDKITVTQDLRTHKNQQPPIPKQTGNKTVKEKSAKHVKAGNHHASPPSAPLPEPGRMSPALQPRARSGLSPNPGPQSSPQQRGMDGLSLGSAAPGDAGRPKLSLIRRRVGSSGVHPQRYSKGPSSSSDIGFAKARTLAP